MKSGFLDGELQVQKSGGGGALQMILDIEQEEYLQNTMLAGVEVLVQEKYSPPMVGDFGINVPVGAMTSIVMNKKIVSMFCCCCCCFSHTHS